MTAIIFDAVSGHAVGLAAGVVALAGFTAFWVLLPGWMRVSHR
jgi:hypothetical protein